ncbi:gliding motility protein GldM [Halosquirtibacter xylanolyticus]|uniref:type IX secretion system motor protein PorM/GldM n=1 Tax=Halosquirtibacter xylanolyticus TaxID=3374599 RepID=UPI003747FB9F|nr:gliding motility protein GldM [Prolixibacteraceae bacterium]
MGAKFCAEAPRQKLIGVMYLVYTAMLALNVDKNVLNAFTTVDHGLEMTIQNFNAKNIQTYARFDQAAAVNPKKVGKYKTKADSVRNKTDRLVKHIQDLKEFIVCKADQKPKADFDNIEKKDDTHIAAEVMLNEGKGKVLKEMLEGYRENLVTMVKQDTALVSALNKSLSTDKPKKIKGELPQTWESSRFDGYPLIAVVTLMTKMQSDLRNAEADVINYLFKQIDAKSFKVNKLLSQVIPNSTYVLEGGTYQSQIFLAAVDTTSYPSITVNGKKLKVNGNGKAIFSVPATKAGDYSYNGKIRFKMPNGSYKNFPFKGEYQVARPTLTISPTKMNVFYKGVPNPVSISVPGVLPSQLEPQVSNGKIKRTKSGYEVYPTTAGKKAVVSVYANLPSGKKLMGKMDFRVKRVPDPIAEIFGLSNGAVLKGKFKRGVQVEAVLKDFDFDLKFKVKTFVVSTSKRGFVVEKKSNSDRLTSDQIKLIKGVTRGSRVYIENIIAHGDDGTDRRLPSISLRIN